MPRTELGSLMKEWMNQGGEGEGNVPESSLVRLQKNGGWPIEIGSRAAPEIYLSNDGVSIHLDVLLQETCG